MPLRTFQLFFGLIIGGAQMATAQIDRSRNVIQLAYHEPITRPAPHPASADLYANLRQFLPTNLVLALATAPARLESRAGVGQPHSPITDMAASMTLGTFGDHNEGARSRAFSHSQSLQPIFEPNTPRLLSSVMRGESLDAQSNFGGERAETLLLANVRRFELSRGWQIGGGGLFSFGWNRASRLVVHCGPSFKPPRESFEGERCIGLLFRFDLGNHTPAH
jgi:hypothetical protein